MQTISLDISRKRSVPPIYAKQSEVGRKFLAVITDNGVPYNIPDNALLSVWYEGDTDAGNYSSIEEKSAFSIDGNKVVVELVAQMLLKPGSGDLCLSVTHGDGGETNTWNIPYCVEYKPGAGSAVPTEYYTALTEAGAVAAKAAIDAIKAANEAGEAVTGYVKSADLESLLLDYERRKTPIGYTFSWSPVTGSDIDLTTPEKVAAHFGFGTWEQIKDRFLLSAGDDYAAGEIGGEAEHTLTIDEMPAHRHDFEYSIDNQRTWNKIDGVGKDGANAGDKYIAVGNSVELFVNYSIRTAESGGNQAISTMPPYLAVYVWKRIA